LGIVADSKDGFYSAEAFVGRSVDQAFDTGVNQGTGAHGARFDGGVDGGAGEAVIAEAGCGDSQC